MMDHAASSLIKDTTTAGFREDVMSESMRQPVLVDFCRDGFYAGTGYAVIDAPVEVVRRAIEDWGSYQSVYPKTVEVREVGTQGRPFPGADATRPRDDSPWSIMSTSRRTKAGWCSPSTSCGPSPTTSRRPGATGGSSRRRTAARSPAAYVVASRVPMGVVNLLSASMADKIERNLLDTPGNLKKWVEGPQGNRYRDAVASR